MSARAVSAERTIEIPLAPEQRRELARQLKAKWSMAIVLAPIGGLVMAVGVRVYLGPDGGPLAAAVAVAFTVLLIAAVLAKYWLIRRERVALRTIGSLAVKRYGNPPIVNRYVLAGRRKVWLEMDMPHVKSFRAVDYTKGEAFPLALFDASGALVWSRPGYTPSAFGAAATADRVEFG